MMPKRRQRCSRARRSRRSATWAEAWRGSVPRVLERAVRVDRLAVGVPRGLADLDAVHHLAFELLRAVLAPRRRSPVLLAIDVVGLVLHLPAREKAHASADLFADDV